MQRKDLALRVLSTAAIMSIVTSIAAPAFADIYYIGNGSIDVKTITKGDSQYVEVTQGGKTYTDTSNEIVIKDGHSEEDAALKEADRAEGTRAKPAVAPAAGAATQELEAAGTAAAAGPTAGESQPDPDAAFNLSEEEEDSEEGKDPTDNPTDNPTANPTDDPTANPKKDVVYEYAPADPDSEQQATKLAPTTSADLTAKTNEVTLDDAPAAAPTTPTAPAADPPAEGSAANPSQNVIRVINDWVGKALNIRLSNVNIKQTYDSKYADGTWNTRGGYYGVSAAEVQGAGNTKIELDGKNTLDSSNLGGKAGLNKQGNGTMTITDETDDTGNKITAPKSGDSGSLTAKGGGSNGAAGIGGNTGENTKNITIEGYATVDATGGGNGAGIGGGGGTAQGVSGNAENIIIQGHSKVTATAQNGAAIGGGSAFGSGNSYYGGSAKGIVIRDHATVVAKGAGTIGSSGDGAAIGAAGYSGNHTEAEVTIGTAGATTEEEDVHIIATGLYGSAIGNGKVDTKVTIQGHVTILTASSRSQAAIGSCNGNVEVTIKDNVAIDTEDTAFNASNLNQVSASSSIGGGYIASNSGRTVKVTIDGKENGNVRLGEKSALDGWDGAISGTEVKIGNNVLLKMKQARSDHKYIAVNGAEAAVGKRNDPDAGGLVNTIGDNTELWYTDYYNQLQKIVHGKNVCKKKPGKKIGHEDATCGKDGYDKYQCDYEHDAKNPSCDLTWQEVLTATGNHQHTEIRNKKDATCTEKGYTGDTWCKDCGNQIATGTEIPVLGHQWHSDNDDTHSCVRGDVTEDHSYSEWTTVTPATCTTAGQKQRTCTKCSHVETKEIPATGHNWVDNGDGTHGCDHPGCTEKHPHNWVDKGNGTHTCPDCGATEALPVNTNSALELRVVDAEGMDQPFTVSQNGTLRTYTGAYDTATLTGDLNTLCYLQEHGAQTIQFVTNGQTSSFAISDLLAQGSGSEVFYLTHRGAEEPTLLLVEADRSELVKD